MNEYYFFSEQNNFETEQKLPNLVAAKLYAAHMKACNKLDSIKFTCESRHGIAVSEPVYSV